LISVISNFNFFWPPKSTNILYLSKVYLYISWTTLDIC